MTLLLIKHLSFNLVLLSRNMHYYETNFKTLKPQTLTPFYPESTLEQPTNMSGYSSLVVSEFMGILEVDTTVESLVAFRPPSKFTIKTMMTLT